MGQVSQSQAKTVRFRCQRCLSQLSAPARRIGSKQRCPRCQLSLKVPTLEEAARQGVRKEGYELREADVPNTVTVKAADLEYVKVTCSLCGTMMQATVDQIGREISCPDCETPTLVPASARKPKRRSEAPAHPEGYGVDESARPWVFESKRSGEAKSNSRDNNRGRATEAQRSKDRGRYIPIHCSLCGALMQVPRREVGKMHECLDCGKKLVVTLDDIDRQIKKNAPLKTGGSGESYIAHEVPSEDELRRQEAIKHSTAGQMIRVSCPACGMFMYAPKEAIGHELSCHECAHLFVLAKPEKTVGPEDARAASESGRGKGRRRAAQSASSEPRRERAASTDDHELPHSVNYARISPEAMSTTSLTTGVFQFPFYFESLQRIVLLLLLAMIPGGLLAGMYAVASMGAGLAVLAVGVFALFTAVNWLGLAVASMLTATMETAYGAQRVTGWPGVGWRDWIDEALLFIAALVFCGMPAGVMGFLASVVGLGGLFCAIGIFFCYPFLQLSLLETASPFDPVSMVMFRSLSTARRSWILFYVLAAALLAATMGLVLGVDLLLHQWRLSFGAWAAVMGTSIVPVGIVVAMIYFRLLGRLAWVCMHSEEEDSGVALVEEE